MGRNAPQTVLRSQVQALVRLYHAASGTALGLASVAIDGLDQGWRERVQRIRALPREAPRRKQMIEGLLQQVEQTLWQQRSELEALRTADVALAHDALIIAGRGKPIDVAHPSTSASDPAR